MIFSIIISYDILGNYFDYPKMSSITEFLSIFVVINESCKLNRKMCKIYVKDQTDLLHCKNDTCLATIHTKYICEITT